MVKIANSFTLVCHLACFHPTKCNHKLTVKFFFLPFGSLQAAYSGFLKH